MKMLKIDDKYTVEYDPHNNDRPGVIYRKGVPWADWDKIANHSNLMLAMFHALLAKQWTDVDVENPPAPHMVALYNDSCTAETLTKFDNSDEFYLGEGDSMDKGEVRGCFSKWMPAPEGFEPHFMTLTGD